MARNEALFDLSGTVVSKLKDDAARMSTGMTTLGMIAVLTWTRRE